MVNEGKDAAADREAMAAVERHHGQMMLRLRTLGDTLLEAVGRDDGSEAHDAHAALQEWCENELLPHALAEEKFLYELAQDRPEATMLVTAMLIEHRSIVSALDRLRGAEGVRAAAQAKVLEALFCLHLEKQNTILLPFIVEQPDVSLLSAVQGLHELTGELHAARSGPAHTTTEGRLD